MYCLSNDNKSFWSNYIQTRLHTQSKIEATEEMIKMKAQITSTISVILYKSSKDVFCEVLGYTICKLYGEEVVRCSFNVCTSRDTRFTWCNEMAPHEWRRFDLGSCRIFDIFSIVVIYWYFNTIFRINCMVTKIKLARLIFFDSGNIFSNCYIWKALNVIGIHVFVEGICFYPLRNIKKNCWRKSAIN